MPNVFLSQNLGFQVPGPVMASALNVSCYAFSLLNRALCRFLGNNMPEENQECTEGAWPLPCRPAPLQLECVPTVYRNSVPLCFLHGLTCAAQRWSDAEWQLGLLPADKALFISSLG